MVERTTVRLPEELLRRARRKAAAEGRTLTSLIEDGLRAVIAEKPGAVGKRKLPRISTASGSELVDISDSAALQEMEDIDYVERMKRYK